jgi:hypothetical protein
MTMNDIDLLKARMEAVEEAHHAINEATETLHERLEAVEYALAELKRSGQVHIAECGEDRMFKPHARQVPPPLDVSNVGQVPHLERSKADSHPRQEGSRPARPHEPAQPAPLSRKQIEG